MRSASFVAMLILAGAVSAAPAQRVEIALCLDTSGSMDGLLDSAKRKLWAVVNELAKADPAPDLRVALFSYGNNTYADKKGFVRREVELTTDLDEVYKKLNALKTAPAGSEEYVARVCLHALHDLKWNYEKGTVRIIFVCGNEPVDQDREVPLKYVAELARDTKKAVINTIYCGSATHGDADGWKQFAMQSKGKYANIDQNKAAEVAIATPFDAEINKLGMKLNDTYLWYGAKGADAKSNQTAQDAAAGRAAGGALAERNETKVGRYYKLPEVDLIDRLDKDKSFDVKKLKADELPEELRKLKPEEREAYLKKKAGERKEIQEKVSRLTAQRALYMEAERAKKAKPGGDQALDEALIGILRDQTGAKKK